MFVPLSQKFRYERYLPVWPTAARDFVMLCHWRPLRDGGVVVINRSIEHKGAPALPSFVRAGLFETDLCSTFR